jgi:hypothetical protein
MSKKWLGALVALGMMGAGAAPAAAQGVTVPGCYGAVVIVCDPTVSTYGGVETSMTQYPVCAGSCVTVPGPGVDTSNLDRLVGCASWTTRSGSGQEVCAAVSTNDADNIVCVYDINSDYACLP